MTAINVAQESRCKEPCEHWRICAFEALKRGSSWGSFCAQPGQDPAVWTNMTQDFWAGPETNCPMGYWSGLAPVDPALTKAAIQNAMHERVAADLASIIAVVAPDVTPEDLQQRLGDLVSGGYVVPEVAAKLEEKVPAAVSALSALRAEPAEGGNA